MKGYVVQLRRVERKKLEQMVKKGEAKATEIRRANILLKADANGLNWTDEHIAQAVECTPDTVARVRRRYKRCGLQGAIRRKQQEKPSRERILDGKGEARVLAVACSRAPGGRKHWTLRMLADRVVELQIAEAISHETIRRTLKKTR